MPSVLQYKMKLFQYLTSMDKKRCAVLVYKLVAAVGVDMSHFCAVNVERHPVLINSQAFRVHSWVSTQDISERSRTGTICELHSKHVIIFSEYLKILFCRIASRTFWLSFGSSRK